MKLKELLLGRLKYHQEKVTFYEKQLVEMRKIDAVLSEEAGRIGKGGSNQTPTDNLESSVKVHKNQCIYYKFMAEHVVPSATYRLDEHALVRLGIQASHY